MAEKLFVKGFRTFAPRQGAPDFVLGSLVITIAEFKDFVNGEAREYITEYEGKPQLRVDILNGKDGRVNFAVNTYKKESGSVDFEKPEPQIKSDAKQKSVRDAMESNAGKDNSSDLPF
jgi:hypothetical protein